MNSHTKFTWNIKTARPQDNTNDTRNNGVNVSPSSDHTYIKLFHGYNGYGKMSTLSKQNVDTIRNINGNVILSIGNFPDTWNTQRRYSRFSKIPKNLPNNIVSLEIESCDVKKIPILPNSITGLTIKNCLIKKLPDSWPNKLEYLNLSYNRIKEFPKNLPTSLKQLCLEENPITEVSGINSGLEVLDLKYTNVVQLGVLPTSLESLYICGSDIKKPDDIEWEDENNIARYRKFIEKEEKIKLLDDEIQKLKLENEKKIQELESQKKQLN